MASRTEVRVRLPVLDVQRLLHKDKDCPCDKGQDDEEKMDNVDGHSVEQGDCYNCGFKLVAPTKNHSRRKLKGNDMHAVDHSPGSETPCTSGLRPE